MGFGPFGLNLEGHPSGCPLVLFIFVFVLYAMPVDQLRTVVIHAHGMVAAKSSNVVVQLLSRKLDFTKLHHVQFIPGGRIRVTFSSVEYRNVVLERKTIQIDDFQFLNVTASDSPVTSVYVHYLPVESTCLVILGFVLPSCLLVPSMR